MRKLFIVACLMLFFGCTTGELMADIQPGMSKNRVIEILGKPDGFMSDGEYEAIKYTNRLISGWAWDRADYSVVFKNEKVVSYGSGQVRTKQSGMSTILIIAPY